MKLSSKLVIIITASSVFALGSCTKDDTGWSSSNSSGDSSGEDASGTSGSGTTSLDGVTTDGDVSSFTIALDTTSLSETLTVDAADDDYVANTTFGDTVYVHYSTSGAATVTGDSKGYATVSGNDVTVNNTGSLAILYVLSGTTTDGFFKLYSDKKQGIQLNGASITNPNGAAINNQSKKRTFVVLTSGTSNELTDGTTYSDATDAEDMKGTFFSEGQLVFSGSGSLQIDANAKAGISSDDYVRFMPFCHVYVDASSGNGIRGKDKVQVTGGVINVNVTGAADKGISSDSKVQIDGGRTTILTSGATAYDSDDKEYKGCCGVKADTLFTMNGGQLFCKSTGAGGKGISSDINAQFTGGDVRIITTGNDANDVSPKGIKADSKVYFNGGSAKVRVSHSEGIESKGTLTIDAGDVEVYAYDDAINSASTLTINGGYIYSHATNNDGVDANGNLIINGGVVIAEGAGSPECGLDAAEQYNYYQNGGIVVAIGGNLQATASSSKQASVSASVSSGTTIALLDGSSTILSYKTPSGNGKALFISTPSLSSGSSYSLLTNCTATGGTSFYGLTTGCTVTGTTAGSLTAALQVGSSMSGGGGGGRW